MRKSIYTETADEVLKAVRASGQKLSRAQLTRWHLFEVIPRPIQRPRSKGRGTETVYPRDTIEHVLATIPLMRQHGLFDQAKFELWLMGFDISSHFIAYHLREAAWLGPEIPPSIKASFKKEAKEIESALGGERAVNILAELSDEDLYHFWREEQAIVYRELVAKLPVGYMLDWYQGTLFLTRWYLASRLPEPLHQRLALFAIIIDLFKHARAIPGLAPKRPRGRPRKYVR